MPTELTRFHIALLALWDDAKQARHGAGQPFSLREIAKALPKEASGKRLWVQRISEWTSTRTQDGRPRTPRLPRESHIEQAIALVELLSKWAGHTSFREQKWRTLYDESRRGRALATPARDTIVDSDLVDRTVLIDGLTDDQAFSFEVKKAIDAPQDAKIPVLPSYVKRGHDQKLASVVEYVSQGNSTIAFLVGESSTGKTRACWEALRRLPDGWRLWHPIQPSHSRALLDDLYRIGPRTVVWLNDAHHYLLPGDPAIGNQVAAGVRELVRDEHRAPILVLGTMWLERWHDIRKAPDHGPSAMPHVKELIADKTIQVPSRFVGASGDDPRLREAFEHADDGEVIQYLAGGPILLESYNNSPATVKAVIDVAIDAMCLGHSPGLSGSLFRAAEGYLSNTQWNRVRDDDWLDKALADAGEEWRGTPGPLTEIKPSWDDPLGGQRLFRLADYLAQHQDRDRKPPPAAFWRAAAKYARTALDQAELGWSAELRGRLKHAAELYAAAVDAGHPAALVRLAEIRERVGDVTGAETYLRQAADAGVDHALFKVACLRYRTGDLTGALELYRELTSAVIPVVPALVNLAAILESQHDLAGADKALEKAWRLSGIEDYLFRHIEFRHRVGDEAGASELEFLTYTNGLAELDPVLVPAWEAGELELAGDRMGALRVLYQARTREDPAEPIDSGHAFLVDLPQYGLDADGTPSDPW